MDENNNVCGLDMLNNVENHEQCEYFCCVGNSADIINNVDNGGESAWTDGDDYYYSKMDDDDVGWCSCFSEVIDVSAMHGKCKSQQSCTEEIV